MNPRVKDVTPKDDYRLVITFTNRELGIFDWLLSRICAGQTSSSACKHLFLTEIQRCRVFSNALSRIARFAAHRRSCV